MHEAGPQYPQHIEILKAQLDELNEENGRHKLSPDERSGIFYKAVDLIVGQLITAQTDEDAARIVEVTDETLRWTMGGQGSFQDSVRMDLFKAVIPVLVQRLIDAKTDEVEDGHQAD